MHQQEWRARLATPNNLPFIDGVTKDPRLVLGTRRIEPGLAVRTHEIFQRAPLTTLARRLVPDNAAAAWEVSRWYDYRPFALVLTFPGRSRHFWPDAALVSTRPSRVRWPSGCSALVAMADYVAVTPPGTAWGVVGDAACGTLPVKARRIDDEDAEALASMAL